MNGQPLTEDSNKTYRTIPGSVFFLPNEVPEAIAPVVLEAVGSTM